MRAIFLAMIFFLMGQLDMYGFHLKSGVILEPISIRDTSGMIQTVQSFLKWYKAHLNEKRNFKFLYRDDQNAFQVDTLQCRKYLRWLESSGYLSKSYFADWDKYFMSKAQYLRENPEKVEEPEGFEFDLVLITPEPEQFLDRIPKLKFRLIQHEGHKGTLAVVEGEYEFEMSNYGGKWKIDYIATMNYD